MQMATSKVENSAQVSSSWLKFVHHQVYISSSQCEASLTLTNECNHGKRYCPYFATIWTRSYRNYRIRGKLRMFFFYSRKTFQTNANLGWYSKITLKTSIGCSNSMMELHILDTYEKIVLLSCHGYLIFSFDKK
jgi:hypothetical protein